MAEGEVVDAAAVAVEDVVANSTGAAAPSRKFLGVYFILFYVIFPLVQWFDKFS